MNESVCRDKIKVVVIDRYMPESIHSYFRAQLEGVAEVSFHETTPSDEELDSATVIVAWQLQEEYYAKARNCVLFQALSAGLNNKRVEALHRITSIALANLHSNSYAVAQHALALLLAVANKLVIYHDRTRTGLWRSELDNPPSLTLRGITIGVLGLGAIGAKVVKLLGGFDLTLAGCSRSGRGIPGLELERTYASQALMEFLRELEVLIVCLPLTEETTGLIGEEQLQALKPGGIVVNVSRGPIVKEKALFDAVRLGRLSGAGIDVWYNYKQAGKAEKFYPYTYPFHELPTMVLSPHRAASPIYADDRWDDALENIKRAAAGRSDFLNLVDGRQGY